MHKTTLGTDHKMRMSTDRHIEVTEGVYVYVCVCVCGWVGGCGCACVYVSVYHSVITTVAILSPTSGMLNVTRGLKTPAQDKDGSMPCWCSMFVCRNIYSSHELV